MTATSTFDWTDATCDPRHRATAMAATPRRPAGRRPVAGAAYGPKSSPDCPAVRHGNAAAYANHRCRCPQAREDWRIYNKRRRERRNQPVFIAGAGTARRLQALAAIGWPARQLAARLDIDPSQIIRLYHAERVNTATAAAVSRLYTALSDMPGPSTVGRLRALGKGWAPPIGWDDDTIDDPAARPAHCTQRRTTDLDNLVDEIAVERVVAGQRLSLNTAERRAVAVAVVRRGGGASVLTRLLGCSGHVATRLLAETAHDAAAGYGAAA